MDDQLRKWHGFSVTLCESMGAFAYVAVGRVNEALETQVYGNWAGSVPVGTVSRAPHVAYGKLGELVLLGAGLDGKLIMTPTDNDLGYGWMGAVAQNGVVVAVSKWAQQHDRLLALLTLYHAVHAPLELHHAGFRFPSLDAYQTENSLFRGGMERPAEDHLRTYFPMRPGYYREHQFFPDGPQDRARHWDIVCPDPMDLLRFIAQAYGNEPVLWEPGPHDPFGVAWIPDKDGDKLGVMARVAFWDV